MKKLLYILCCCLTVALLVSPVQAVDSYEFVGGNPDEFYQTGEVYTSQWGSNIVVPELNQAYGFESSKPINAPGHHANTAAPADDSGGSYGLLGSTELVLYPEAAPTKNSNSYALTSVEGLRQADGSIGVLIIPAIGLTVTAYDGDVTAAMMKGVGFIDSTSAWNGNIGLSGHNRGVTHHFGNLNKLAVGDEVTYTTSLGTRTYVVTTVQKIAANDWGYLQYTTDNRITLITCVADQPQYRLCVQALEAPNR